MASITYHSGYHYQLVEDYTVESAITGVDVTIRFLRLMPSGLLTIEAGYAWDGASGPAVDTRTIMRGSLVHDALYQLLREGHLPPSYRLQADRLLYTLCREDGMSWPRAQWVYWGVRWGGSLHARASTRTTGIHTAP